jgi:hypothetical protein
MAPTKKPIKTAVQTVDEELQEIRSSKTGIMTIPGVKVETVTTLVIGTALLCTHKFDEKMRRMMEDKQQGRAKGAREAKNPELVFEGARYRLPDGTDGVPAGGIKACIVSGARGEVSATMTGSKGAVFVVPDDARTNLVRILTPTTPVRRTDVCRNATGVADIRYRPEYFPWALYLRIEYLPSLLSASQLLQMLAHAGRAEGLCEWRPGSPKSKSGQWGTFRLAYDDEIEAFEDGRLFESAKNQLIKKGAKNQLIAAE